MLKNYIILVCGNKDTFNNLAEILLGFLVQIVVVFKVIGNYQVGLLVVKV